MTARVKSERRPGMWADVTVPYVDLIVEAQDGRLWAESAGEGAGSTFSFTLPAAK